MRGVIGEDHSSYAGGGVAQLGEHHVRNVGVEGSIPFSSTTFLFSILTMNTGIEPAAKAAPLPDEMRSLGYTATNIPRGKAQAENRLSGPHGRNKGRSRIRHDHHVLLRPF